MKTTKTTTTGTAIDYTSIPGVKMFATLDSAVNHAAMYRKPMPIMIPGKGFAVLPRATR